MTSVGDVIAIIDLVHKLGSLVKDSIHSPVAFQELITDLNSLSSALDHVYQLLSEPNSSPMESSIANDIKTALEQCETLLNDFMGKSKGEGYYDSFKPGGSGHLLVDLWRKLRWAYSMPSKVDTLKRNILEQKMTINTMFSVSNHVALGQVQHTSQHNTELQLLHLSKLEKINTGIQELQKIPRSLGYTWEGSDITPVWFIDMRDVKIHLPMEICETWELFEGFLKIYFKNKVGQGYVDRGDYDLTGAESDRVILPAIWSSEIKAGVKIYMDAILRLKGSSRRKCPSCGKSSSAIPQNNGKSTCSFCHTTFRVSDKYIEVERDRDMGSRRARGASALNDETCFLRRFHVIYTTILPPRARRTARSGKNRPKSRPQTRSPNQGGGNNTGTPSHPLNAITTNKPNQPRPYGAKPQVPAPQLPPPDSDPSTSKAPSSHPPITSQSWRGRKRRGQGARMEAKGQKDKVPSLPKSLDSAALECKVKVGAGRDDTIPTNGHTSLGPTLPCDPHVITRERRNREEPGSQGHHTRRQRPRVVRGATEDLFEGAPRA